MKVKAIIAAAVLSTGFVSASVNAEESVMERFLGAVVEQAVSTTSYELALGVQQTVANTVHLFDINGVTEQGKVEITDIAANGSDVEVDDKIGE